MERGGIFRRGASRAGEGWWETSSRLALMDQIPQFEYVCDEEIRQNFPSVDLIIVER